MFNFVSQWTLERICKRRRFNGDYKCAVRLEYLMRWWGHGSGRVQLDRVAGRLDMQHLFSQAPATMTLGYVFEASGERRSKDEHVKIDSSQSDSNDALADGNPRYLRLGSLSSL